MERVIAMNIKIINKFLFVSFFILIPVFTGYAQNVSMEYSRVMSSVRAMGMGNAFYGVSDDKWAAFYNPAGLARNKMHWQLDLVPLTIGVNNNILSTGTDALSGGFNTNNLGNTIGNLLGSYNNIAPINWFTAFTYKNWSFGFFVNANVNLLTYNNVNPTVGAKIRGDAGAVVTYAHSFLEDKSLHFGVSLYGLYRIGYQGMYNAVDAAGAGIDTNAILNDALNNTGWGIFLSAGVMYELPWLRKVLNPRVGVSLNDIGFQTMKSYNRIDPSLNLSFAISPNWKMISSNIVVDFNDILFTNGDDQSFGKRVNIGAEVSFWNRIFLRTGLHQGYWTAGAGFDVWLLRLNYAYYTEELGAYAGQIPDERHVIEIVLGWDMMQKRQD